NIMPFIKGLGIDYKNLEASNAISSNTSDVDGDKYVISSLKLAAAYAAFANNVIYNKPYYENKVVFNDATSVAKQPDEKRTIK
ncbi:penicillin-binding protein, partial [Enterococcus faecalis]